jgi:hypothetical protein
LHLLLDTLRHPMHAVMCVLRLDIRGLDALGR